MTVWIVWQSGDGSWHAYDQAASAWKVQGEALWARDDSANRTQVRARTHYRAVRAAKDYWKRRTQHVPHVEDDDGKLEGAGTHGPRVTI